MARYEVRRTNFHAKDKNSGGPRDASNEIVSQHRKPFVAIENAEALRAGTDCSTCDCYVVLDTMTMLQVAP